MGKLEPTERWRRHVIERFAALQQSGELKPLRARGLKALGRTGLLTGEEWHLGFRERASSPEYRQWYGECESMASRFGLAPWVVAMTCLLEGYSPEHEPFVIEAQWPRIRVVTEVADPLFLRWLCYEARKMCLYVVQRVGSSEATMVYMSPEPPPEVLPALSRPPRDTAFHMRVETPPAYPPEAASQLQTNAARLARQLLENLGYRVPRRLRSSPLAGMAAVLKVSKQRLTEEDTIEIVDELYPGQDIPEEDKLVRLLKSRKHKLRKRLVEPYRQQP